jgi:ATP-binding protein involved in chromosome partitioning
MLTPQVILEELKKIRYPGLSRDIVSFGMIKDIEIADAGITVILKAPSARPEVIAEVATAIRQSVTSLSESPSVKVEVDRTPSAPLTGAMHRRSIPGVKHIIAVASGKGGVGKSTVAVNLALAMRSLGWQIGLMDADVYGPSAAMMLGVGERAAVTAERRIVPQERFGIRYVSMALFVGDETAVIWRGPMVTKLETEFLFNVEWGDLDCLVLDLPPGTGDAQLTITQRVALDGGVIVTMPQAIALLDVKRGVTMFSEVKIPVLGIVENMSYHLCRKCGRRHELFSHGGGARYAAELGVPFLGELPITPELREGGDKGLPLVAVHPGHPVSDAFKSIAANVVAQLSQPHVHGHLH